MDDPADETHALPTLTELVSFLAWGIALAATIAATKALEAAFPTVDIALLLWAAGLPIIAVFYCCLRWWAKRHA